MQHTLFKSSLKNTLLASLFSLSSIASATVIEFETNVGNFKVNLYDESTPTTVQNFIDYIEAGAFTNNIVHRKVNSFVVQGGGYFFDGSFPLTPIATSPAIQNEPVWSNVKGTIAMAKRSGDHHSATSQWFVNLKDNSAMLDGTEGGYTVFGQVIDDGMTVLEEIEALNTCPGSEIPLINFTDEQCAAGIPGAENLVTVLSVTIIDPAVNTVEGLTMVENTSKPDVETPNNSGSSSGGGSFAFALLALAGFTRLFRK